MRTIELVLMSALVVLVPATLVFYYRIRTGIRDRHPREWQRIVAGRDTRDEFRRTLRRIRGGRFRDDVLERDAATFRRLGWLTVATLLGGLLAAFVRDLGGV